jgi:hypothetical protein
MLMVREHITVKLHENNNNNKTRSSVVRSNLTTLDWLD